MDIKNKLSAHSICGKFDPSIQLAAPLTVHVGAFPSLIRFWLPLLVITDFILNPLLVLHALSFPAQVSVKVLKTLDLFIL